MGYAWFGGSYAEQSCQVKSGLNGRLRSVRGILPATLAAQQAGFPRVIVPLRQAREPKLVQGIEVYGIAEQQVDPYPSGRSTAKFASTKPIPGFR